VCEVKWNFVNISNKCKKKVRLFLSTPWRLHKVSRFAGLLILNLDITLMFYQLHASAAVARGKKFDTHWTGDWVDLKIYLDVLENWSPAPAEIRITDHVTHSQFTIATELSRLKRKIIFCTIKCRVASLMSMYSDVNYLQYSMQNTGFVSHENLKRSKIVRV
jgi:hypothetical protein